MILQDHAYRLPDAAILKARLDRAEEQRLELQKKLRNARDREKRLRVSSQALLQTLAEKKLLEEELSAKLECFSGKYM